MYLCVIKIFLRVLVMLNQHRAENAREIRRDSMIIVVCDR